MCQFLKNDQARWRFNILVIYVCKVYLRPFLIFAQKFWNLVKFYDQFTRKLKMKFTNGD